MEVSGHNPWQNRIVGQDKVAPDQLLANPFNFRVHPSYQQEATSGSLDALGWIQQVIVNKNTGHLIDGHLRVQLALRYGEKVVPVLYVDLTEDEERQALLMLDTIAAMAQTDKEKLNEALQKVQSDDRRIQEMLSGLAIKEGIIPLDFQPTDIEGEEWSDGKKKIVCPECGYELED